MILLCVGIYFGVHIDYFKVDGIAVVGNEEISDEEILKLSELEVGENIFDVHPLFAQHRIKENLYIEKVRVKRKLPNKIEISVTERSGKAQAKLVWKMLLRALSTVRFWKLRFPVQELFSSISPVAEILRCLT